MCREPIWTASGQTYWVVMEAVVSYPTCPGFSSILLRYQNTSTRMNTDSHAGRAVHSGETLGGNARRRRGTAPLSWHKMQALPCRTCGFKGSARPFHHRPFVSQPCRTLGTRRGSWRWFDFQCSVRSSRLQHICVFSHQCEIVQYDGRLMLKQDWYYDLGRIFSYQCFKTFIPSSSYLQSI